MRVNEIVLNYKSINKGQIIKDSKEIIPLKQIFCLNIDNKCYNKKDTINQSCFDVRFNNIGKGYININNVTVRLATSNKELPIKLLETSGEKVSVGGIEYIRELVRVNTIEIKENKNFKFGVDFGLTTLLKKENGKRKRISVLTLEEIEENFKSNIQKKAKYLLNWDDKNIANIKFKFDQETLDSYLKRHKSPIKVVYYKNAYIPYIKLPFWVENINAELVKEILDRGIGKHINRGFGKVSLIKKIKREKRCIDMNINL